MAITALRSQADMLNGALPSFDFTEGGPLLACVRGAAVASSITAFGPLFFYARIAPKAFKYVPDHIALVLRQKYRILSQCAIIAALIMMLLWAVLEARAAGDATSLSQTFTALPPLLFSTRFGHILLAQMLLLALSGVIQGRGVSAQKLSLAAIPAGAAILLQAGHSHAVAMYPGVSLLLVSQIIHVAAAAIWLGTLLPLLFLVRAASPGAASTAARYYSAYGTRCVLLLTLTALFQGWILIGSWPALIGTTYGWMALLKATLFAALLGFAANNRFKLTPALADHAPLTAKRDLVRSIACETVFGLAVIIAAAFLAQLSPSIHEQAVWLFNKQPSLITVNEDADFRREAAEAILALAFAAGLIGLAIFIRRARWLIILGAIAICGLAIPHLDLFFVDAYPTSFYRSPTGFSTISIAEGQPLYAAHCASCHGQAGRGDGPAAQSLPVHPADLTAPHLWGHSDGQLFWWLSHGVEDPEAGQVMPGFAAQLTEDQRWRLIDYIRANNAGLAYAANGTWAPPVRAPDIQVSCTDGTATLEDFRGSVVRLIFAGKEVIPKPPADLQDRLITVVVGKGDAKPDDNFCVASDPAVAKAYGIVTGLKPEALADVQFLIDTNGWLRAMQRPGESITNWNDPIQLTTDVLALCTHPIEGAEVDHAHHH